MLCGYETARNSSRQRSSFVCREMARAVTSGMTMGATVAHVVFRSPTDSARRNLHQLRLPSMCY